MKEDPLFNEINVYYPTKRSLALYWILGPTSIEFAKAIMCIELSITLAIDAVVPALKLIFIPLRGMNQLNGISLPAELKSFT